MPEIRVAVDATCISPHPTGTGVYARNVLSAFDSIRPDIKFHLLVSDNLPKDDDLFGLGDSDTFHLEPVEPRPVGPMRQLRFSAKLRSLTPQPDVFHSLTSDLPLFHRVPSVVTIHDLKYVRYPEYLGRLGRFKSAYLEWAMRLGGRKAERVLAVSQSTEDDLVDLLNLPEERITVTSLALPSKSRTPHTEHGASEGVLEDLPPRYVLFVGETRPHKNLRRAITGFESFASRTGDDEIGFVHVGATYNRHKVDIPGDMSELNAERFHAVGEVSNATLNLIYEEAELLLFPSLYEGFGLPLLEAMALGVPVITSNVSSMPEVAGDAAVLVDPHDIQDIAEAIEAVVTNPELRAELERKGTERVRRFSWKDTAERTISVYREAADGN